MPGARAWMESRLRRASRLTSDAALLTGRGYAYAASRMSLVGVRAVMRAAVHVAEVWLLARDFPFEFLAPLLAMRAFPSLVTGVHWGALETLRGLVRTATLSNRRDQARVATEAWLAWTVLAGLVLVLGVTTLVLRQPDPENGADGLYGTFALLIGATMASELWTRTYHAGVFALGRVYRPVWTIFAADALELLIILRLYRVVGPFSLHAAVLAGAIFRGNVTYVYARRGYAARRLSVPHPFAPRSLRKLRIADMVTSSKHALATLPLQLDRMLLIALLRAPTAAPEVVPLALPYYALRPVAAYAQGWARIFYADFVRLDIAPLGMLRARFERTLRSASLVAGAASASGLAIGACALFGRPGVEAALWLAPLSLVRSHFALQQVRLFAYGAFRTLMYIGAVLLLGVIVAGQLDVTDRVMVGIVIVTLLVAQVAFRNAGSAAYRRRAELTHRLPFSAWVAELTSQQTPVRMAVALVDVGIARPGAVTKVLTDALPVGHVARVGRSWVTWWEPSDAAKSRTSLAELLAGSVSKLDLIEAANGQAALAEACARKALPAGVVHALSGDRAPNPHAELRARASELVPGALVIDLAGASPELSSLSPRELSLVRRAVVAEAREQRSVPAWAAWQAAVYAPRGEVELAFVWRAHTEGGGTLRRVVLAASLRDSVVHGRVPQAAS